jgi:hypothetical protein
MDLQLFIPITKIDVARRLVTGTIAEEIPDRADEIMDYETAKPMFAAWSEEIVKASNGKSAGNLRAMHGSVAAGRLDSIHFDDEARRILTVAKVIDDGEWQKVLEGVYTGFSMGGRYVRRWKDPEREELTRYTPQPMEVSLVDHPCIPSATFEVIKADGSVELRKFQSPHERDIARETRVFADPGYQSDRKKRFPLDSEAHIRAAWAHIHHPGNAARYSTEQVNEIRARIVAAWKAKIDRHGPPSASGTQELQRLAKNWGDVAALAALLDDVTETLGDTALPDPLQAQLAALIDILRSLVEQAAQSPLVPELDGDVADEDNAPPANAERASDDPEDLDDDDRLSAAVKRSEGSGLHKIVVSRLDAMSGAFDALTRRVERIEAQPLPGGPVLKTIAVTKAQDMAGAIAPAGDPFAQFQQHLAQLPPEQRAHLLTRLALRNPLG